MIGHVTMRATQKLTPLAVKNADKPGLYGDGLGLYLQVSSFGTKSWLFRFMRDGTARKMGLGAVHTVSLAKARQLAAEARLKIVDGDDPIEARKARRTLAKVEAAKAISFKDCAEKYVASNEAGWRNAKHAGQWRATLETYAYPILANLPVSAVDTALVLKVIEPIWTSKPETAGRVRGRIESILNWATAREYRTGENPARWRGHLDNVLPKRSKVAKVKHHDAVAYQELPDFMRVLRGQSFISARALEFTILSAARTGEAIGAEWIEIDLDKRIWTVPAERMKAGREHRVPLSDRLVEMLADLPREGRFVFPGSKEGRPLSNMAMLELLRGQRGQGATVHGFRSSFRDWAAEQTAYPNELCEAALAHTVSDKTEAAYRRGDMFEKRRRLMDDWAKFCAAPATVGENVVKMRA